VEAELHVDEDVIGQAKEIVFALFYSMRGAGESDEEKKHTSKQFS
jgi:hypothetical protein